MTYFLNYPIDGRIVKVKNTVKARHSTNWRAPKHARRNAFGESAYEPFGLSSGEPKKCISAGILGCPPDGNVSTVQYAFLKPRRRLLALPPVIDLSRAGLLGLPPVIDLSKVSHAKPVQYAFLRT
jgi:hypothetical protein